MEIKPALLEVEGFEIMIKKLFSEVEYPENTKEKNKIVEEYNKKLNALIKKESADKEFKTSLLIELIMLASIAFVFIYGDVSVILKLVYILPASFFTIYDFYLLCKIKKESYSNEKNLYKKSLSLILIIILMMYVATYMFAVISMGDKFTTKAGFVLWGMLMTLSIGSFLKAVKDVPSKFLNKYLDPKRKYHKQPSWALNITRVLVVLVCIYKPYMLLMGMVFILITPLVYTATFGYYVYLQYDKIQELAK